MEKRERSINTMSRSGDATAIRWVEKHRRNDCNHRLVRLVVLRMVGDNIRLTISRNVCTVAAGIHGDDKTFEQYIVQIFFITVILCFLEGYLVRGIIDDYRKSKKA